MEDENEYEDEEWDEAEASTSSAALESGEPVPARHEESPAAPGDEDGAASEQAYASEWSEQDSPARGNSDAVHLLSAQLSTRMVDPDEEKDTIAYQPKANDISSLSPADNENDKSNEFSDRKARKTYPESIVQSHAQRVRMNSSSAQKKKLNWQPQNVDWGAEGARVAAERIREFRKLGRLRDEQQKLAHTIQQQQRQQYRAINKPMHESLGVANISAQQRLEMLQREQRKQRKKIADAAQLERKERWYNLPGETGTRMPRRMAAAHVSDLNKRELHLQRGKQKVQEDRKRDIHENLMRLQNRARSVIAKSQGAYVNGSYLLRRSFNQTPHTTNARRGGQLSSPESVGFTTSQSCERYELPIPISDTTIALAPIIFTGTVRIATEYSEGVEMDYSVSESTLGTDTELDVSTPTHFQAPSPVAPIDSAESLVACASTSDDHLVQCAELSVPAPTDTQEQSSAVPTHSPENSMAGGVTNHDDPCAQMPPDSFIDDAESPSIIVPNEKTTDLPMPSTEIRGATPLESLVADDADFSSELIEHTTAAPEKSVVDVDSLTDDDGVVSESFDYADDFTP